MFFLCSNLKQPVLQCRQHTKSHLSQNSEQRWVISTGNAAEDLTLENVTVGNTGAVLYEGDRFSDPSDFDRSLTNVILTATTPVRPCLPSARPMAPMAVILILRT